MRQKERTALPVSSKIQITYIKKIADLFNCENDGLVQIAFYSTRPIQAGEELRYNYQCQEAPWKKPPSSEDFPDFDLSNTSVDLDLIDINEFDASHMDRGVEEHKLVQDPPAGAPQVLMTTDNTPTVIELTMPSATGMPETINLPCTISQTVPQMTCHRSKVGDMHPETMGPDTNILAEPMIMSHHFKSSYILQEPMTETIATINHLSIPCQSIPQESIDIMNNTATPCQSIPQSIATINPSSAPCQSVETINKAATPCQYTEQGPIDITCQSIW